MSPLRERMVWLVQNRRLGASLAQVQQLKYGVIGVSRRAADILRKVRPEDRSAPGPTMKINALKVLDPR